MNFTFAQIFLAALCFYFLVHSLTCLAEIVHLKRTENKVPEVLRSKITPAEHLKAARYDVARTKLNWAEVTFTTAVIFFLTTGDGINTISDYLMSTVGDQFAFHWMLPTTVGVIFVLIDLPFCWYKEFRLREAFGYTRQEPRLWFKHYLLVTILGCVTILPLLWIVLFLWRGTGSAWWLAGWAIFSVYLIFPLNLARRLQYFFTPTRARPIKDEALINSLAQLEDKTGLSIGSVRITRAADNEELPPSFAFGHRQNVLVFIRDDVYQRLSTTSLQAVVAHALARNLSHMYFQAWLICSATALAVFAFMAWLAPQSWFLDEIGLRVYGPGPYYGSLLTFAIVALPVLFFPFRLMLSGFLRSLIFRADAYALRHTSLKRLTQALIDLTPVPMRHSSLTLSFFDLLFSHEPSLMTRITRITSIHDRMVSDKAKELAQQQQLQIRHQTENARAALRLRESRDRLIAAQTQDVKAQFERRRFERELVKNARTNYLEKGAPLPAAMIAYHDPKEAEALAALAQDNSTHRMYGQSLWTGLKDIIRRTRAYLRSLKNKQSDNPVNSVNNEHTQENQTETYPTAPVNTQPEQADAQTKANEQPEQVELTQVTQDIEQDNTETAKTDSPQAVEHTSQSSEPVNEVKTEDVFESTATQENNASLNSELPSEQTTVREESSNLIETTTVQVDADTRTSDATNDQELEEKAEEAAKESHPSLSSETQDKVKPLITIEHDEPVTVPPTEPVSGVVMTTDAIEKPARRRKAIKTVAKRHKKLYEEKQS